MDKHIAAMIHDTGHWAYGIMFAILFAETGFVVTPFLPGDTLLFAAGLFATPEKHALNLWILLPILTLGPLCGDSVNFAIGRWLGPVLFSNEKSKIFNRRHLEDTHEFFEKYGSKTIILARWVPIVRTFAPFVAGMSQIRYREFIAYSAIGAVLWVWVCVLAGYFFGGIKVIQDNFELAMLGMVAITVTPLVFEGLRRRAKGKKNKDLLKASAEDPR